MRLRDWWWLLKTKLLGLGTTSTTSCIEMSVPLSACAVQAWKQSTTLWQAVVQWHRRTTLLVIIRSPPSFTGTFVGIFRFQWSAGGIGINLISLLVLDYIVEMWDTTIPTAGKIKANRPDICLRDKKANTCFLIDIICPADGNVGRKQAEKLAKYGDLRVEVSRMWQCRTQVVPVVLGALGTVHAGIARWLDIIPGHHNLQHLQKAVLLGSARILRKVMSYYV